MWSFGTGISCGRRVGESKLVLKFKSRGHLFNDIRVSKNYERSIVKLTGKLSVLLGALCAGRKSCIAQTHCSMELRKLEEFSR